MDAKRALIACQEEEVHGPEEFERLNGQEPRNGDDQDGHVEPGYREGSDDSLFPNVIIQEKLRGPMSSGRGPAVEMRPLTGGRFSDDRDLDGKRGSEVSLEDGRGSENERGNWSHKLDFFLSLLGYSVGLSNIWRFPYLCYKNGGGAFLIPYWICMFLCGVPLFFMEVAIGQFTSRSAVAMWSIAPLFRGAGMASVVVALIVSTYFNVVMSYAVFFLVHSLTTSDLPWSSCQNWWNTPDCLDYNNRTTADMYSEYMAWTRNSSYTEGEQYVEMFANRTLRSPSDEFFHHRVLQMSKGFEGSGGFVWELVACLVPTWIITGLCLAKGVKSVGKVVYFTATFPYVILTILLVRGVTLPGAMDGILFYVKPNFTMLANPQVWADAAFQVFFSLGPGWGGLVTMGSYNKFNNNCYKDSLVVPILMGLTSFYAGFVVFSVVGFMAKVVKRPVSEVVEKGPGLAFIMYPEVVTKLPFSQLWSAVFFFMFFIVGLDSVFVMIETAISAVWDELPGKRKIGRHWILLVSCFCMMLAGLPFCTKGGIFMVTLVDTYSAVFSVMVVCILEIISVAWIYGAEKFLNDIAFMIGFKPPAIWAFIWRFVTSGIVLTIFVLSILQFEETLTYGDYPFPEWSFYVGWGVSLISFVCVPGYIIYCYYNAKGDTPLKKLKACFLPSSQWGPALRDNHTEWVLYAKQPDYKNSTLTNQLKRLFA